QVLAVAAEMHPGEDHLFEALRGEALHLAQHLARREAPALAARHRYDAERTEEVAPFLHLQERARLARERPRAERADGGRAAALADRDPCQVGRGRGDRFD